MLDGTKHKIVNAAKAKVANEVSDYLSRPKSAVSLQLEPDARSLQQIREGEYSSAIGNCMESYDRVQGIEITIQGNHYIRDARNMGASGGYAQRKPQADFVAYAGQFLSSCRAFETIYKAEGRNQDDETAYVRGLAACMYQMAHSQGDKLKFKASRQELLELMHKKDPKNSQINKMMKKPALMPSIELLNYELEAALVRVGVKKGDVAKKMDAAKEFASLKDPHYHITTISREPNTKAVIVESSIKAPSLSAETIIELEEIKGMAPTLSSQTKTATNIPWFDELSTFNKKLVIDHIDEILMAGNGEKILPTQLRKILPGLKNAYLEVRQVKRQDQPLKTVLEGLRSASPACLLKKGADKATKDNVTVVQELAGKKEVCLNGLFTPWQPGGGNHEASSLIKNAIKALNRKGHPITEALTPADKRGRFTNSKPAVKDSSEIFGTFTPVNPWRIISKQDNTFSNMLKGAAAHLAVPAAGKKDYESVVEYIKSGKGNSKNMHKKIDKLGFDKDIKMALKNLVECRRMEKQWIRLFDSQNTNYNRSARMAMVAHDFSEGGALDRHLSSAENYNKIHKEKLESQYPKAAIISFCMSGKDRNGIRNCHAAVLVVSRELGDEKFNNSVAAAVVGAGHQCYLAGVQGATTCCFGTKKDSRGSMPQAYKDAGLQDVLYRKTSGSNKFKTDKDKTYTYSPKVEEPKIAPEPALSVSKHTKRVMSEDDKQRSR